MLKLKLFSILLVVAAMPIVAARFLPWWGTLLVIGLVITLVLAFAPTLIGMVIQEHLVRMFKDKARVLADAGAEVLAVNPTDRPEETENMPNTRYVMVEVIITPEQPGLYDPADLALVPQSAQPEEEVPIAHSVKLTRVEEDGSEHECEQVSGKQRLRIVYQVPEDLRGSVKFRYYYSDFGAFVLP